MIDTKLLRQKILDLAIRGKLVPQNLTDEPASELLKKIKTEKEALVKAGKIKKDKHESHIFKGDDNRYYETMDGKTSDITDKIPFDLPDSWAWCRLKQVFSVVSARRVHKADWKSSGIPFYRAREIVKLSETGSINNDLFISEEQYNAFKQSSGVPSQGDLMVTAVGTIGKVYIVKEHDVFYYKDASVVCFENHHSLNPYFYKNIFSAPFVVIQIYANSTGSTVDTITIEKAEQYLIPLPPLAEQQRIVEQIETLLKYVDEIDADATNLEKYFSLAKQKILDLAIRGKLVPQDPNDEPASVLLERIRAEKAKLIKEGKIKKDKHESIIFRRDNSHYEKLNGKERCIDDEIPFEIPDSWAWVRLQTIVYNHGQHVPQSDFCYIDIGSIDNLNQCLNSQENIVSAHKAPSRARRIVELGDILYSTVRPYLHNMCIVNRTFSKEVIASTGFAVFACFDGINNNFLFRYLMSPSFDSYANSTDISKGIAYPAINDEKLYKALIPLPPLAEQKRIVAKIEELLSHIEEYGKAKTSPVPLNH